MKKEVATEKEVKMEDASKEAPIGLNYYEESLKYEERQAALNSEAENRKSFMTICQKLRELMKEIMRLKNEKPPQWNVAVEECKVKALMYMLSLKKISRIQKVRVKNSRDKSSDFRQEVDNITLLLQNLLYEVSHLKKEVRKCLEFRSADAEIDLVSIDQFYKEAPENISLMDKTKNNPHQQRLAQLHWELEQRRGQTQLSDKLTSEKNAIAEIIATQENKLSSLLPRINEILEATLPLQTSLNLPLDNSKKQQKISEYLPAPLYTLWTQVCAYSEACDSSILAEIVGDFDAVQSINTAHDEENNKADDSDSDADLDIHEENTQRKKRSQNEKRTCDNEDEPVDLIQQQVLSLHPLHIVLTVKTKENNSVIIKFYYALHLRVVTVKCSLELASSCPEPLLVDVLKGEDLLDFLFPGDSGRESPNPANVYQFSRLGIDSLSSEHLNSIGKLYKWAQTLSGLSFVKRECPAVDKTEVSSCGLADELIEQNLVHQKNAIETLSWKLSVDHMHRIISALKGRLQARLALQAQLVALETAKSLSALPVPADSVHQFFPGKVSSEFCSWTPLAWSDYVSTDATHHLTKYNVVDSTWHTFKAFYQRKSVTLDAYVAVSQDYPTVAPVFGVELSWNGTFTASNHPHVMQLESEVNVYFAELFSNRSDRLHLLSLQLYRLAMCLDILTEAGSVSKDKKGSLSQTEFHKEKIFFRPNRGPDRSLPYKYLPKLGVFAQR